jgi:hypothetical protein
LVWGYDRPDSLGVRFHRQATEASLPNSTAARISGLSRSPARRVVAMLLDAAMTHCLFAKSIAG